MYTNLISLATVKLAKSWTLTYTFFMSSSQLVQLEHIGTVFRKRKRDGCTDKKRFGLGAVFLPLSPPHLVSFPRSLLLSFKTLNN